MAGPGLAERFAAYGIEGQQVTDENIVSIRGAAAELVGDVRAGAGPRFLECATCRWREHVGPAEDWDAGYRDGAEEKKRFANDPLSFLGNLLNDETRAAIDSAVAADISEAFALAEAAPYPEAEMLIDHVYG